jgi:hypothetical protein
VLSDERLGTKLSGMTLPFVAFGADQWDGFVETWPLLADKQPLLSAWAHVPEKHLRTALEKRWLGPADAAVFEPLWHTHPALLKEHVLSALRTNDPIALSALRTAPATLWAELLTPLLERSRRLNDAERDTIASWLHQTVAERQPGWRDAYAALHQLESRAFELQRARG